MIFNSKSIVLKDGRTATLRSPELADAAPMLHYMRKACGETNFLMRYPEEWPLDIGKEENWIRWTCSDENVMNISCWVDGNIAGNCEICFNGWAKKAHRASVSIAILKDYWSLGIGSALFEVMIAEARKRNIEIMELTFVEGNDRARHLYEKFGFRVVAEHPNMFKNKDGSYSSEFYMQKIM